MGQPVIHFEILGRDGPALRSYYTDLFGWKFDNSAPMDYGTVDGRDNGSEGNMSIGGGIGSAPEGYGGHVTFYVAVPDVEEALVKAESLGGKRMMGPDKVMENIEIGQFTDPEGHLVGLVKVTM
jgi:predicted enzyme related to lactoylglutathione lyase